MILTFTERKFRKLNKKLGKLEDEYKKYNDSNDPQGATRKIIAARIEILKKNIQIVENELKGIYTYSTDTVRPSVRKRKYRRRRW